jgi:ribosomal protein S18 acetylase RimI-like enzyme
VTAVTVRTALPADSVAIAEVQVASWRVAYAGIVPRSYLDQMSEARNAAAWERGISQERRTIVVAEDGDVVVGFACGGVPARDSLTGADAELDAIYVHPSRQRAGTGRLLAAEVAADAAADGARSMAVWVLTDNRPARAFYERLGAVICGGVVRDIDFGWGVPLEEMAYRWNDLSRLH